MFLKKTLKFKKASLRYNRNSNKRYLMYMFFLIKAFFVLHLILFLNLAKAEPDLAKAEDLVPKEVIQAEKAIWKYSNSFVGNQATGFFISEKHFVTNFHALMPDQISQDAFDSTISHVKLSQVGSDRVLRIKKALQISVLYDLAILEIEGEVSDYLHIGDSSLFSGDLYISGYPSGFFSKITHKKEYGIYKADYRYYISVDHSYLRGASGSPVLNKRGEVIGIASYATVNMMVVINSNDLKTLISRGFGSTSCSLMALKKCIKEEVENLKEKAKKGQVFAQHALATIYYKGEGVEQSYEIAIKWYKLATKQGDILAKFMLAIMYYHGEGTKQNYEEAFRWFKESAEKGFALAQYALATMYSSGEGVEQNIEESIKWLKLAAKQGYSQAQYSLADIYYYGKGVDKNFAEAFRWYKLAAKQGFARAQYVLATIYYYGQKVDKNIEEAIKWLKLAAEKKFTLAQYGLATMYYKGEGVEQNYETAIKWYKLAADKGFAPAKRFLKTHRIKICSKVFLQKVKSLLGF